jgi:hypothetical protein
MKMKTYILIVIITLSGAAAWGVEGMEEKDPFYPGSRPAAKVPANTSASTAVSSGTSTWGRDPFSNPFGGKAPATKVSASASRGKGLTGIIYSPDVRLAIINGEMFREGSMLGEKKLVDIRMRSVVFLNAAGGQEEEFLEDFSIRK